MKISFVIPSFNDDRILETISSIINIPKVPRENLEIIIQDGGSNNDLITKINSLIDSKFDKLISAKDKGIFDGINKGLKNSTGDLIATLGSDDRVIELDYNILKDYYNQGFNFIQYDIQYTDENWKPLRYWKARKLSFLNLFLGRQYAHFGLITTKEVYEKIGFFNINNKINADYEFFYDCVIKKKRLGLKEKVIESVFVQMKMGGNSSANLKAILKGNLSILKYMLRKNPLLIFGLLLKPYHKIKEFRKADKQ